MRKLRFEELKFSCQVVNEESTPVNLKGTAEGKIFWEGKKRFLFFSLFLVIFLNAFKAAAAAAKYSLSSLSVLKQDY